MDHREVRAPEDQSVWTDFNHLSFLSQRNNASGSAFLEMHLLAVMMICLAAVEHLDDRTALNGAAFINEMVKTANLMSPNPFNTLSNVTQPLYHAAVVLLKGEKQVNFPKPEPLSAMIARIFLCRTDLLC